MADTLFVVSVAKTATIEEAKQAFIDRGFSIVKVNDDWRILRVSGPEDRVADVENLPCVELMERA